MFLRRAVFIHLCTCSLFSTSACNNISMLAANSTGNICISSREISCCCMCIANTSGRFVYMQYCMSLKCPWWILQWPLAVFMISNVLESMEHIITFVFQFSFPLNPKWEVPLVQLWVSVVANLLLHYVAKVHLLNTEMPSFLGSAECPVRTGSVQYMETTTTPITINACRHNVK